MILSDVYEHQEESAHVDIVTLFFQSTEKTIADLKPYIFKAICEYSIIKVSDQKKR